MLKKGIMNLSCRELRKVFKRGGVAIAVIGLGSLGQSIAAVFPK